MGFESEREKESLLQNAVHAAIGCVWTKDSATRREVENYTAEFVKAVPLFVGRRWGLAAATGAFALGEVKTGDSLGMQSVEFTAGTAKGFLTKKAFDVFGVKDWNFAQKGMSMGAASRLLDVGLTPSNYVIDGHVDLHEGARRAVMNAGDAKALSVDVLTFGVARAVPGAFGREWARNGLLANSLTGATFGFTAGTLGELQHQWHNGDTVDFGKLLKAGTIEAGVMGLAAGVGHKLTGAEWQAKLNERQLRQALQLESSGISRATDGAKPTDPSGYTAYFLSDGAANAVRGLKIDGKIEPLRWTPPERLHVTESFGLKQSEGDAWAKDASQRNLQIRVIGHAMDNTGVEALHVALDGRSMRSDGLPYHITRSLADGRKAVESGPMIAKALEVQQARENGASSNVSAEDLGRYSYRKLATNEQFDVTFEPRFRESSTQPKEVKEKTSKPEIPFEQLAPKMQVITALKATPPEYLTNLIATRTPEQRAGSYFDLSPDQLKAVLFRAQWEPYNPLDAKGQPIIMGEAKGYRATIDGGRLGMAEISSLPDSAPLYLIDPKGINNWSVSTVGAVEPKTSHATMIVGKEPGDSHYAVWTFHPGEPVRPSAVTLDAILKALPVQTGELPANGIGRRIPISRSQLDALNASLPADAQMTLAKIESDANLSTGN